MVEPPSDELMRMASLIISVIANYLLCVLGAYDNDMIVCKTSHMQIVQRYMYTYMYTHGCLVQLLQGWGWGKALALLVTI